MRRLRFIDLFAGLGGFHRALASLGHSCVFASESNPELLDLYRENFPDSAGVAYGDLRISKFKVPAHDILCAGFPCQPFSKSGAQKGRDDDRGTLFDEIIEIARLHKPVLILLENVGNFERHDEGRTWAHVQELLKDAGYPCIKAATHCSSGGDGLLSPHHLGFPQHRERFFCVASRVELTEKPFPPRGDKSSTDLRTQLLTDAALVDADWAECRPSAQQMECIEHWNELLRLVPAAVRLPSFPIWAEELRATYPIVGTVPADLSLDQLARHASRHGPVDSSMGRDELLGLLPSYARTSSFPGWKQAFIRQNRTWFDEVRPHLTEQWLERLWKFPPSLRKLEWNCQGEVRDLWAHVLQFRPSGLRVKRMTSIPALVAMTETQIPFVGPRRRFLTRREGLALQGFPMSHALPVRRTDAFRALGNAVHVGVVREVARRAVDALPPVVAQQNNSSATVRHVESSAVIHTAHVI